jgi:autotransporter-associated beta strand protein
VGNVTLNGGTLTQSATDSGSYQGYQFLGGITVNGSSASTISTGNGKANHLLGGGTTNFNVADVTGSSAVDLTVSAPLTNGSGDYAGTGSLEKSGAGTMTLTGTNTYSGTTNVTGGTLALGASGSIATSSSINLGASTTLDVSAVSGGWTLGAAQTLTGVGTVGGAAMIAGDLRTGNSAGTMSFTGNLGLNAGSDWFVEIGGIGTGDYDRVLVGGNLAAGGLISLVLINGFTPEAGDSFQIADFDTFTDNGYTFDLVGAGLEPGLEWDLTQFESDGIVGVVPEPGVFWICGLGAGFALLRRRRR